MKLLWWILTGLSFGTALLGVYDMDWGAIAGGFGCCTWFVIRAYRPVDYP